ncbi:MAG: bifunctional oligoribonuclease/PAP phosphatase NrnA [Lachnospiraceae bacterium]|nr:bifunctional oligoribonuclease/PAP phosphatase NrnA [Lachnospiraceae bacterium]
MTRTTISSIDTLIKDIHKIAIVGHQNPDGDCIGSSMGLGLYLRERYPQLLVKIYQEALPTNFLCMPQHQLMLHEMPDEEEIREFDLLIICDVANTDRIGLFYDKALDFRQTLVIDHHIGSGALREGGLCYVDEKASSTSELITRLVDEAYLTQDAAAYLYIGMAHDTGIFRYDCTAPETMEKAAMLMRKGFDFSVLLHKTFIEKTYLQNRLLAEVLRASSLHLHDRVISGVLTLEQMQHFCALPKHTEGIVNQLQNTRGIEVAIFLYAVSEKSFKISLRSMQYVDVSMIAAAFGGGGHIKAAGATAEGDADGIISSILEEIKKQL